MQKYYLITHLLAAALDFHEYNFSPHLCDYVFLIAKIIFGKV